MRNKRGMEILSEEIVFIVVNLLFIVLIALFVYSRMSSVAQYEEVYAKQIALFLDVAKPGMELKITMDKNLEKAKKDLDISDLKNVVEINGNVVKVRLLQDSAGYTYSFFSKVDVEVFPIDNKNFDPVASGGSITKTDFGGYLIRVK
jgi:hypothetical protein